MKTDKLFYRIFLSQPSLITELLPDIPDNCQLEHTTNSHYGKIVQSREASFYRSAPWRKKPF
jgi:predicted transposase YdaD